MLFLITLFSVYPAEATSPSRAGESIAETNRIILILDASGSMWGKRGGKTKISIAKEVTTQLIDEMPANFEVGLSAYGHRRKGDCRDIEMLVPVGPLDPAAMKNRINTISPKGKTPLSAAVRQAAKALRSTEQRATVVLVSDGIETCHLDPCLVATELAMRGVDFTVHVIGFDLSEAEQARLRCMADKTGGLFLPATDAASLRNALSHTIVKTQEVPTPIKEDAGTARLQGPDTIPEGTLFHIQWRGPDSRRDYITIARKGDEALRFIDYVYTKSGNPAEFTAPYGPGDYELRYIHAYTRKVIAQASIRVTSAQADISPPSSIKVAAQFQVPWQGPDEDGDYITIAKTDDDAEQNLNYAYTHDGNPATLQAPYETGTYEVRYIRDRDSKILAKAAVTVNEVDAQVTPAKSATVGKPFEVPWQGPDEGGDYITIAKTGDDAGQNLSYAYTSDGNPATLQMPYEIGTYEVRYIRDRDTKILAKAAVTLSEVDAQVTPAKSATVGKPFEVPWQGPDEGGDYITIAKTGDDAGQNLSYAYTSDGNPATLQAPNEAGTYEVRYIRDRDTKILAKAAITIQALSSR
jgi:Ca-activated chloride channel family protein